MFIIGAELAKDGPNKGKILKVVKRKLPFNEISGISVRYYGRIDY